MSEGDTVEKEHLLRQILYLQDVITETLSIALNADTHTLIHTHLLSVVQSSVHVSLVLFFQLVILCTTHLLVDDEELVEILSHQHSTGHHAHSLAFESVSEEVERECQILIEEEVEIGG